MSWFDPEKMVKSLISGLGVSPEDFVAFIGMARNEFLEMRADRLAFKPASIRVVQEMNARMDRLELLLLQIHAVHFPPPQKGAIEHERHDINGHG